MGLWTSRPPYFCLTWTQNLISHTRRIHWLTHRTYTNPFCPTRKPCAVVLELIPCWILLLANKWAERNPNISHSDRASIKPSHDASKGSLGCKADAELFSQRHNPQVDPYNPAVHLIPECNRCRLKCQIHPS